MISVLNHYQRLSLNISARNRVSYLIPTDLLTLIGGDCGYWTYDRGLKWQVFESILIGGVVLFTVFFWHWCQRGRSSFNWQKLVDKSEEGVPEVLGFHQCQRGILLGRLLTRLTQRFYGCHWWRSDLRWWRSMVERNSAD